MSAGEQVALFDADELDALFPTSFQRSLAFCPHCRGTGWRDISTNGDRRVTRCDHQQPVAVASIDYKTAATGER